MDTATLGAPVYPGAVLRDQGVVTSTPAGGTSVTAGFMTRDPFDAVDAFYQQQLGAKARRFRVATPKGSVSLFEIGSARDLVSVHVTVSKPSETDILIAHVTRGSGGG